MKQVLIALAISACAYTGAIAQTTTCPAVTPKHKTVVKHKSAVHATPKTTTKTTTTQTTACRMIAYQVCTILPDRRHVSCYTSTDSNEHIQTGPTTYFGPTGPLPGEVVKFKVRTVVIKGESKGSYCKRNKEDNATLCYSPGILIRDEDGYYSYGEPTQEKTTVVVTTK